MKILYITEGGLSQDYQRDMLFHGLRSLFGADVVDVNPITSMYQSAMPQKGIMYGRGFTVYCTLPDIAVDRTDISTKIRNRYYDLVIYGSIHRCRNFYQEVENFYPKNRVAAIDGEDCPPFGPHNGIFQCPWPYFKKENEMGLDWTYPIEFGIPKEKVATTDVPKTAEIAQSMPRDITHSQTSYKFDNETDYYNSYRTSMFGITKFKACWDCLRHYEIIACRCVPLFENIENCPPKTMTKFPKNLCIEANNMFKSRDFSRYQDLLNRFIEVTPTLTTDAVALRVLDIMNSIKI